MPNEQFVLFPEQTPPEQTASGTICAYAASQTWEKDRPKELGQVATPQPLARVMAKWVVSATPPPRTILDPAVGHGSLLAACSDLSPQSQLTGVESDTKTFDEASCSAPEGTRLVQGDYLQLNVGGHDAIIANPPYVKAAHLSYSEAEWQEFEHLFETKLDRLTNLYALFLLKIHKDLNENGRAAVLIPAEFLNANFGVAIKRLILASVRPAGILVFDSSTKVFEKAITTSCLVFLDKRETKPPEIWSIRATCVEDAARFVDYLLGEGGDGVAPVDCSGNRAEAKWLNALLHEAPTREDANMVHRIGDFCACKRGIATGDNSYFTLTSSQAAEHQLPDEALDHCLTKASDVATFVFSAADLAQLRTDGRRCLLLNPKRPSPEVERYITAGIEKGIHEKFLPSHRPTWYLPENRAVADIWVPVFSRGDVRFTLNRSGAKNLTCFHGLYGKGLTSEQLIFLAVYLNSSFGQEAFRKVNRFYGSGLNKVEPKDVEAMQCPPIPDVEPITAQLLLTSLEATGNPRKDAAGRLASLLQQLFPELFPR